MERQSTERDEREAGAESTHAPVSSRTIMVRDSMS